MKADYIKERSANLRLKLNLSANAIIALISALLIKLSSLISGASVLDAYLVIFGFMMVVIAVKYYLDKNEELDKLTQKLYEYDDN